MQPARQVESAAPGPLSTSFSLAPHGGYPPSGIGVNSSPDSPAGLVPTLPRGNARQDVPASRAPR